MKAVCILGSPRSDGSTATILEKITDIFKERGIEVTRYDLGKANIGYCLGCMTCANDEKCVQRDDMDIISSCIVESDIVMIASPSYWGDVTGQMKVFIDRCTPFCNTNPDRKMISKGKTGVAVVVRAGQNVKENEDLLATIEHFLGHLEIPLKHRFHVEGISTVRDLESRPDVLERAITFGREIVNSVSDSI